MFNSLFRGILCDTPKRGKNLVIVPEFTSCVCLWCQWLLFICLDISLCRRGNALVESFNQCKTYELTCDRSWQLTIKSIHIINTSLMSDEMPFYHSFAEVMTYALFYRINTVRQHIYYWQHYYISKHKCT